MLPLHTAHWVPFRSTSSYIHFSSVQPTRCPLFCSPCAPLRLRSAGIRTAHSLRPLRLRLLRFSCIVRPPAYPCGKCTPAASYGAGIAPSASVGAFLPATSVGARRRFRSCLSPAPYVGSLKRLTHCTGYSPVPHRTCRRRYYLADPGCKVSDLQFPLPLLKRLAVPYYRITIWLKNRRKPLQGIRQIDHFNIDAVYNMIWQKARAHYNDSILVDVEVAMLPKRSTAVRNFLNKKSKAN